MKLIIVVALVMIAALVGPSKAEKAGGPSGKTEEENVTEVSQRLGKVLAGFAQLRIAQNHFPTTDLFGCMASPSATNETVGEFKSQVLFEKKPLEFAGDIFLDITSGSDEFKFARLLVIPVLIRRQKTV